MKNFMKKLFSLLLVGVVFVSMFGFIAPNRVDAAEEEPSKGTVYVKNTTRRNAYNTHFVVDFYDASGNNIGGYNSGWLTRWGKRYCTIPQEAKSVTVQVKASGCSGESGRFKVIYFVFKLDENNDFLDGSISVIASGKYAQKSNIRQESTGCWKFDHKEIF